MRKWIEIEKIYLKYNLRENLTYNIYITGFNSPT